MYQELLQKIEILKNLPEDTLNIIGKSLKTINYQRGNMIFSEFDIAKGVYFVKSGVVRLTKGDHTGKEIVVCIKKAGELFAEACLFTEEGTLYPATATMIQEGDVLFLKTADLERELFINPELGIEIIRYMSYQLRGFTTTLRDIALLDVYSKTISALDRLAKDFGEKNGYGVNIELPLTIQEFANLIGARRESVSRVFSKLRSDNIITIHERKIVISDWCRFCTMYRMQMFA
ncbi:Crp/Fnr family transcriptional regulator [Ferdinandcohnia quinoae]|uniref:Crp/Fnr family transcriptional regulator n=1 Tax=Fredinandcohnia quinoae TaxID=2918902 RepID=A0AAW5E4V9_9BACI|nr:Crp/Fnr family transcriptional regulator [Fredinandcohnia sp. SECRCQ15]MCH1625864.1 Crp/Fnr family transcriptional regulator [Fredinandcohnia sp. SECRCQ15]